MYTGLLHTHRLAVIIFLLLFLVKLILLLINKSELLEKFSNKTKIPERIVEVLFLLSGIVMLFQVAQVTTMMYIKFLVVAAAIPIAIIGFKRSNKLLAILSVFLIVMAYGLSEMNKIGFDKTEFNSAVVTDASAADYNQQTHGLAIYARNCGVCHGAAGEGGKSGSKDLTASQKTDDEKLQIIRNGKNAMDGYKGFLNETEMTAVLAYVNSLKK